MEFSHRSNTSSRLARWGGSNRRLVITAHHLLLFIMVCYAVVLAPFIDSDFRNYLVIFAGMLGGLLFLSLRLKVTRQVLAGMLCLFFMGLQALFIGGDRDLWSVGLTLVYASGYFAVATLFERVPDKRGFLQKWARVIVYAFATLSIIQMVASFTSLPIPNLIASKGLWSYNSLAFEPSQLGRVVGMTMLAYLMLLREPLRIERLFHFSKSNLALTGAFLITMLLSGSALAASAIAVVFILSRSLVWSMIFAALIVIFWPIVLLVDYEPVNRAAAILSTIGDLDTDALISADSSGASRVVPAVIYLKESVPSEVGFWIGYSGDGLARFFQYRLPGFGDTVAAGFLAGFPVVYGALGILVFLWIFVFLFLTPKTAPLIVFWILFFSSSAWNTQVFWYGLILIQMTSAASGPDKAAVTRAAL
ncbi:MAG: hypothetical protein V7720_12335 [Halioglobus sp.]